MDIYTAAKANPKTEIRGKRTERAKVFQLPDGSKRHLCFGAPIHYLTPVGEGERLAYDEFDDIDIRLVHSEAKVDKTFGNHLALKNKFTYGFRDDGKSEKCIGIRRGVNNQMEWTPKAIKLGGVDKTIPTSFTSIEKASDFSIKHKYTDYDLITNFNEVHLCTAVKTKSQINDFLVQEIINLKGITILNKTKLADSKSSIVEYLPNKDNEFRFATTDGESLWIPTPKMWVEPSEAEMQAPQMDIASREITHRLFEEDGKLIYEKVPTAKGKIWLASKDAPVFIDGDTYTGSTGDGYISRKDSLWSGVRDGTAGNDLLNSTDTLYNYAIQLIRVNDVDYRICRVFLFFDTSSVSSKPSSAVLKVYVTRTSPQPVCALKSTISGTTVNDYAQYNDFSGNEYGHATWTLGAYRSITFNATGQGDISLTGVTKICCRDYTHDYLDVNPANSTQCYAGVTFANSATNKPYLDIVEPSGWTGKVMGVTDPAKIMGVAVADIKSVMGVE